MGLLFGVFAIFNLLQINVNSVGVDAGYFLSISRDWINLGRIPGIDTFTVYTTIGYFFYAIPFVFLNIPSIEVFLVLNLLLFFFTFLIYFNIVESFIENKQLVIIIIFSFLYNLSGITTDIKLENLILFYNVCIIFVISKIYSKSVRDIDKSLYYGILLGILSALSFLTKQYGGLSLLFTVLILEVLKIANKFKISIAIILSFFVVILLYIAVQFYSGLKINNILHQLMGNISVDCNGVDYGEKKIINLLLSLKYYKFDVVLLVGLIIGLLTVFKQKTYREKIFKVVIIFSIIFFAQMPFYFQVLPHYKIFGYPFLLLLCCVYINKWNLDTSKKVMLLNNLTLLGYMLLSCFSFWSWGKIYSQRSIEKKIRINFQKEVAQSLPSGSKVFMLSERKLWFSNGFSTPTPKTISYSFVGLDCLEQAVYQEKPISFWIAGVDKISSKNRFKGYVIVKSKMITYGKNKLYALRLNSINVKSMRAN